ncbi:hypothetical protein LTR17_011886 [Elasticomyces elasticus]|nr:hypothetical protein LTR17_011886 [Elasticomyces elasticus]
MTRPRVLNIHHLKFAVANLDLSMAWYERVLGARHVPALDHFGAMGDRFAAICFLADWGSVYVELRRARNEARNARDWDPVTLTVEKRADLEVWTAWLTRWGTLHSQVLTGLRGWLLVFEDPDGRRLRLYTKEGHDGTETPSRDEFWMALIAPAQTGQMPSIIAFVLVPAVAFLTYSLLHMLYNITLHPLAKVPGPLPAAATRLYESYYELYLGGQYGDQILALHSRYGPIVRISPSEVHILDPTFFDELFNFNPELDKQIQVNDNLQQTPGFELHRQRRKAFDPYFSRASVLRLEALIASLVDKMCTRVEELKGRDTPFSMSTMYRCLTTDIISDYCFSQPFDLLDDPQGNEKHMDAFLGVFKILFLTRQIPWGSWVMSRLKLLPKWMVPTDQGMAWVQDWQGGISRRLRDIKQGKSQETHSSYPHPTVFEQYIQNGNVPAAEKTDDLLLANAVMFVAAARHSKRRSQASGRVMVVYHR